jgi:hypothetical protein
MQLDLTDEESAALLRELLDIIEADQYPLSPRIRVLGGICAKFAAAPPTPQPARPPTLEERDPRRRPRLICNLPQHIALEYQQLAIDARQELVQPFLLFAGSENNLLTGRLCCRRTLKQALEA